MTEVDSDDDTGKVEARVLDPVHTDDEDSVIDEDVRRTAMDMSEEDGVADCSDMIFGARWPPEFSVIELQIAGLHAGATLASDTSCVQRRHSPTHPHLAMPRQRFSTLWGLRAGATLFSNTFCV